MACVVQAKSEEPWIRGRILADVDNSPSAEVQVFAVDYGDVFTVPRSSVRRYPDPVQKKYLAIPELSVPCSLREIEIGKQNLSHGEKSSEEEKKAISKMLRDRQK